MRQDVFLEVSFEPGALTSAGFYGRDEIEDPLNEALIEARLGEVTGGGGGIRGSSIDIEITNTIHFEEALTLIRQVLRDIGAPASTKIVRHKPRRVEYGLYD
jgi:hypothetical protein